MNGERHLLDCVDDGSLLGENMK